MLGLVFAIIILVMVFVKMRNSGLKERYGLWWYWIAFCTALLSLFPPILKWTAFQLGVVVPLNLGFFVAGVVLLLLSLRFSVDLRAEMRTAGVSPRRPRSCASRSSAWSAASMPLRGAASSSGQPTPEKPSSRGKKGKKKR